MEAYAVWGSTDRAIRDDDEDWIVAIYFDRAAAEQHAALANEAVKKTKGRLKDRTVYDPQTGRVDRKHRYYVRPHPLVRHVDEFLERPEVS